MPKTAAERMKAFRARQKIRLAQLAGPSFSDDLAAFAKAEHPADLYVVTRLVDRWFFDLDKRHLRLLARELQDCAEEAEGPDELEGESAA
jgi:hypothetical protein